LAFAQTQGEMAASQEALETGRLAELSDSFRSVANVTRPSVVHVSVKGRRQARRMPDRLEEFFERFGPGPRRQPDRDQEGEGFRDYNPPRTIGNGSGWVYDDKGHIITNYHVVAEADVVEVRFFDKTVKKAEVIGSDPSTDIAVLKVEGDHLHPAELAERSPEQGELVFAFGSPFSFEFSMSQGIVSGKGRQLGILGAAGYENFIQTDAAINPGNSGGPLMNINARVAGMNTAIATRTGGYQGIGFAIPVDMLRKIIPQLIEEGRVARGYIGVVIRDDPKLLKTYGVDHGVVVERVMDASPADEAGLKRGDVIVEVAGKKMADAAELRRTVAGYSPGTEVELTIMRDEQRKTLTIKLAELPEDLAMGGPQRPGPDGDGEVEGHQTLRKLGIEKAQALSEVLAERLGLEKETEGVVIRDVRRGSAAAAEGLRPGVIITHVHGAAVEDVDDLVDELDDKDLTDGVRMSVLVPDGDEWVSRFVVIALPKQ
jgi:serine protease Do